MYQVIKKEVNCQGEEKIFILGNYQTKEEAFLKQQSVKESEVVYYDKI